MKNFLDVSVCVLVAFILGMTVLFSGCGFSVHDQQSSLTEIAEVLKAAEECWEKGARLDAFSQLDVFLTKKSKESLGVALDSHYYIGAFWFELSEFQKSREVFLDAEALLDGAEYSNSDQSLIVWRYIAENSIMLDELELSLVYLEKVSDKLSAFRDPEDKVLSLLKLASIRLSLDELQDDQLVRADAELKLARSIACNFEDEDLLNEVVTNIDSLYAE